MTIVNLAALHRLASALPTLRRCSVVLRHDCSGIQLSTRGGWRRQRLPSLRNDKEMCSILDQKRAYAICIDLSPLASPSQ